MLETCTGELASVMGGQLNLGTMPPLGGALEPVHTITADLNAVRAGDVFIALGDDPYCAPFSAEQALERGALGVIVARRQLEPWAGRFCISVEDTRRALVRIAQWWRHQLQGQLVAVAGGLGKSTAAHLIKAALGQRTPDDERDRSGEHQLPFRLLEINADSETAFLEMPEVPTPDLLQRLGFCQPDLLVWLAGEQKGEASIPRFLEAMNNDGLIVAASDHHLPGQRQFGGNVLWTGRGAWCDFTATSVAYRNGQLTFTVEGQRIQLQRSGRHFLPTVMAAYGVARLMGRSPAHIAEAFLQYQPLAARCRIHQESQYTVIDDSYGGDSRAVRAAMQLLGEWRTENQRVLVLGDTGDAATVARQLGREAVVRYSIGRVLVHGRQAHQVWAGACAAGMPAEHVQAFHDVESLTASLAEVVQPGDVVLVTGGAKSESSHVVSSLRKESSTATCRVDAEHTRRPAATTNLFEALPLAATLRDVNATLPPG